MEEFQRYIRSMVGKGLEGWLSMPEATFLAQCARLVPEGRDIVEIGSFRGLSAVCLAYGSRFGNCVKVYAVDPHAAMVQGPEARYGPVDQEEFYRNITTSGMGSLVYKISLTSESACRAFQGRNIGLLWIDGCHFYKAVSVDLRLWVPLVAEGGLIVLHDRDEAGVAAAIWDGRDLESHPLHGCQHVGSVDKIAVFLVGDSQLAAEWRDRFPATGDNAGDPEDVSRPRIVVP
jgi:hypothetical protein